MRALGPPLFPCLLLAGVLLVSAPDATFAVHGGEEAPVTIPAVDLERLIQAGEPLVAIDLRPFEAYRRGHLRGARSIPLDTIRSRLADVPRAGRVVLYGATTDDAIVAYGALRLRGHRNLAVLEDGLAGWLRHGFPLEAAP